MQTQGPSTVGEKQERLELLKARLDQLGEVKTKLRKLNVALSRVSVAEKKSGKLAIIRSAATYVKAMNDLPTGVKPLVQTISNELLSIQEGIVSNSVKPHDLVLLSGLEAIKEVDKISAKVSSNIEKLSAQLSSDLALDPSEAILLKNQKVKEKIPNIGDKEFIVARAPVLFTFQNKEKHSSVGYIDTDAVRSLGFKADNIGGYTVLHEQLVLGINLNAVQDPVLDDEGNHAKDDQGRLLWKRQTIKEPQTTFKAGKPMKVFKRRDKDFLDVVNKVKKLLERKTNQPYSLVSEQASSLNGARWFWVIPTRDMARLAKAFPGGHPQINKWGFAF